MKNYLITACLGLSLLSFNESAQSSWQDYGKLEVSENGHYIQHKDRSPFLWIADTGWGMIQQLTREEIDHYLDSRKLWFLR